MPIQRRMSERDIESISTKPIIIDDLLSDFYDIEVIIDETLKITDNINSLSVFVDKNFWTSIFKSKKDRTKYNFSSKKVSYKFLIKFKPKKKYVQHLEGYFKLVPYNMQLSIIPDNYYKPIYLYSNINKFEVLSICNLISFDDDFENYLYQDIKNNTSIFKSDKIYKRIVQEIKNKMRHYNIKKLLKFDSVINDLTLHSVDINISDWNLNDIYDSFIPDYNDDELLLSLKSYVSLDMYD